MSDRLNTAITKVMQASIYRCWSSISCDRCHTALTLSASLQMALDPHLLHTARALGWRLSVATVVGLGGAVGDSELAEHVMQRATGSDDRDLCQRCRTLFDAVPAKSR